MAAGASSGGSLESTLDRKFQNVTNTMDSIQGLSTWCIENKKYHSVIVRQWLKHVKKASPSHRLNLLYLANDVIQNCKRKNAIVYRTAFSEVLVDAFLLINSDGDAKVLKSVERILSIWEERSVYEGNLLSDLRSALVKEESPPETPVEQKTPIESTAEIRSRIVAEFVPQAFIDQLSKYQRSVDEVDLREKQLTAMRLDICNSETLKKLKDKAGGKKFSRDFEEGSAQLQEFVKFLEKQNKTSAPILEALSNADVFYEMQYKEVKIVANAYQTFANRVNHLKRKLDSLKATLPSLDDSPLPSPSADAPSPTGSESPFHNLSLAHPDPELDGSALDDDAEPPAPSPLSSPGASPKHATIGASDNIEVEDMELSDEEMDSGGIIVEEQTAYAVQTEVPTPAPHSSDSSVVPQPTVPEVTPLAAPLSAPPAAAVEGVDLGKIGSFLNSLSSVIKNTGPSQDSKNPSSAHTASAALAVLQDQSSLSKLLSKVDMSASDLLNALTKVQAKGGIEGITSLLNSPSSLLSDSPASGKKPPPLSSTLHTVSSPATIISETSNQSPPYQSPLQTQPASSAPTEPEPSTLSDSLESKIHSFLQGNPAFSTFDLGFGSTPTNAASPVQEGTPVRDEGGSTPTQDEVMDKTMVALNPNPVSIGETSSILPQQTPVVPNGQSYQPYPYADNATQSASTAPAANYQQILAQIGDVAPSAASNITNIVEKINESGWFNAIYPEGSSQQSLNVPPGPLETTQPGQFAYQSVQEPIDGADVSTGVYLPPIPGPPAPPNYYNPTGLATGVPEQHPGPMEEPASGVSSLLSGVIVHDHQHKSSFHPDDPISDPHAPEYLDERRYHEDEMYRRERFQEEPYGPPGEPYFGPRRLTPPLSPPEDEYYDYQHGAATLARRPPLPHHPDMRMRGMRPPLRPPPLGHHPRGHPRPPFPGGRAPEPWMRGKRPGPRRGGGGGGGPNFPPKRPFPPRRR
ncbi:regulation of nuclear pre-mRNA domain-containing protein 2a [Boleophthalmus pectinirostris]|uniref:regulation of nuclear pre-mRNA domain-containing protein 2a n=1 Tax=Boleophthalmus pectinirostris TaxID=150288 RepID=UPI00242DE9C4|nr:regulation of nuclear pre-mRNA domain-containing protein 2a [Boleophthalmus pectinirostris]